MFFTDHGVFNCGWKPIDPAFESLCSACIIERYAAEGFDWGWGKPDFDQKAHAWRATCELCVDNKVGRPCDRRERGRRTQAWRHGCFRWKTCEPWEKALFFLSIHGGDPVNWEVFRFTFEEASET